MSNETTMVVEPDLKEAVSPTDPLVGPEDPDLKSERVQDE
jgi:hypothetical protein